MTEKEKLRIDKYLWAIRVYKTRSLAADGCNSGKVKQNGTSVKPAKPVNAGDQYEIKTETKKWIIKVVELLHNRLSFSEAVKYYIDLSPEKEKENGQPAAFVFNTGKRQSKQGRPTKKQQRDLEEFME
jgi:ribosome-associated heat shock protein Hsp15